MTGTVFSPSIIIKYGDGTRRIHSFCTSCKYLTDQHECRLRPRYVDGVTRMYVTVNPAIISAKNCKTAVLLPTIKSLIHLYEACKALCDPRAMLRIDGLNVASKIVAGPILKQSQLSDLLKRDDNQTKLTDQYLDMTLINRYTQAWQNNNNSSTTLTYTLSNRRI